MAWKKRPPRCDDRFLSEPKRTTLNYHLMRTPIFLILASLCLFGTLAFAQDPADFFDYEKELRFQDSLYENNPEISLEEVRRTTELYHQKQADAYYQSYRRRIKQQEKPKQLPGVLQQNQAVVQGITANNTTSEGQVPDAIEYLALVALYNATGGDNWTHNDNWLQGTTNTDFDNWYGVYVEGGDVIAISLISNNLIGAFPSEIGNLSGLININASSNQISNVPPDINKLTSLGGINLSYNQLTDLPNQIGDLHNLKRLHLLDNKISSLPSSIGGLSSLELLWLSQNQLSELPSSISDLSNLDRLLLRFNQLSSLPSDIGRLTKLIILELEYNQLTALPTTVNNLSKLSSLSLGRNQLNNSSFNDICGIISLTSLNLSYNNISAFPATIGNLVNLLRLHLEGNSITHIPSDVGNIISLEYLYLQDNQIESIPATFSNLSNLISLYISGNQVTNLPSYFKNFAELDYLAVSDNRINISEIAHYLTGPDTHGYDVFYYYSQAEVVGEVQTIYTVAGASASLQAFTNHHPQSYYLWQRWQGDNWVPVGQETQDLVLIIPAVAAADSGQYRCRITNNWVTNWNGSLKEQYSAPITLEVEEAPEEDQDTEALHTFVGTIGNLGNLPASWDTSQPISTWEGVKTINGRVAEITLKNKGLTGSI